MKLLCLQLGHSSHRTVADNNLKQNQNCDQQLDVDLKPKHFCFMHNVEEKDLNRLLNERWQYKKSSKIGNLSLKKKLECLSCIDVNEILSKKIRNIKYEWQIFRIHFLLNCLNSPNKADKSPTEQLLQIKLLPRWWYCVFQIHRMRACRRIEAMTTSTMVMSIRLKIIKFAAIDWRCSEFLYGIRASTI